MSDETTQAVEATEVAAPAEAAPVAEVVKEEAAPVAAAEVVEVPAKFKKLVEEIETMTVLELSELVKVFEKKFGVSASAVAVAAPGAAAAGEDAKSTFDLELTDAGAQKIAVIKIVKEVMALGLKEAKDLVDGAPSMLKQGMKKEDADELKKKIEDAGGKVTLK